VFVTTVVRDDDDDRTQGREHALPALFFFTEVPMRLTDLLNPERASKFAFKLFFLLFLLLALPSLAAKALAAIRIPAADAATIVLLWLLASPVAYYIRERRRGTRPATRRTGGSERTPLLPHTEEMI